MALLGNLFEKKTCAFCGSPIGLLGNRKLADGNMCKECADKLSPYFSDRRESTVAEIAAQLDYRLANKEALKDFTVTRRLGDHSKIYIDDNHGKFFVTSALNYMAENPDIIDFADVMACDIEIPESKNEITYDDGDRRMVSFMPAQYDYSYNFYIDIYVNHPYIRNLRFRLNNAPIEIVNEVAHYEKDRLDEIGRRIRAARKAEENGGTQQMNGPVRTPANRPAPQRQTMGPRNPQAFRNGEPNMRHHANMGIHDDRPFAMRPFVFDVEEYADYVEYANLACAVKFAVDSMMSEEGVFSTEYYAECPNCGKTTATSQGVCQFCGFEIIL